MGKKPQKKSGDARVVRCEAEDGINTVCMNRTNRTRRQGDKGAVPSRILSRRPSLAVLGMELTPTFLRAGKTKLMGARVRLVCYLRDHLARQDFFPRTLPPRNHHSCIYIARSSILTTPSSIHHAVFHTPDHRPIIHPNTNELILINNGHSTERQSASCNEWRIPQWCSRK